MTLTCASGTRKGCDDDGEWTCSCALHVLLCSGCAYLDSFDIPTLDLDGVATTRQMYTDLLSASHQLWFPSPVHANHDEHQQRCWHQGMLAGTAKAKACLVTATKAIRVQSAWGRGNTSFLAINIQRLQHHTQSVRCRRAWGHNPTQPNSKV